jgi:hypothetical protein
METEALHSEASYDWLKGNSYRRKKQLLCELLTLGWRLTEPAMETEALHSEASYDLLKGNSYRRKTQLLCELCHGLVTGACDT